MAVRRRRSARLGEILYDFGVQAPLRCAADPKTVVAERRRLHKPSEVGEEELRTALRTHHWKLSATAEALGVGREARGSATRRLVRGLGS